MAKKGQKLKWNTPGNTTLENIRRQISGETDKRGRRVADTARPEQAQAQQGRPKSLKRKSKS